MSNKMPMPNGMTVGAKYNEIVKAMIGGVFVIDMFYTWLSIYHDQYFLST